MATLCAVFVIAAVSAHAGALAPDKILDEENCVTETVPANRVPDEVSTEFGMASPVFGWGALWSVAPDRSWLEPVTPDRSSGDGAIAEDASKAGDPIVGQAAVTGSATWVKPTSATRYATTSWACPAASTRTRAVTAMRQRCPAGPSPVSQSKR